jgi:hypothetical protein
MQIWHTKTCSDQGVNFESELFKHLCNMLQITKLKSTGYHPETNGEVERANKTIKSILNCLVNSHKSDWDVYIDQICFAINSTVNSSTNITPNEVIFGRDLIFPIDLSLNKSNNNSTNNYDKDKELINNYINQIKNYQNSLNKIVKNNIIKSANYQKRQYDLRSRNKTIYKINDLVMYENRLSTDNVEYKGPLKIIKISNDGLTYKIQNLNNEESFNVHYNLILPYEGETPKGEEVIQKRKRGRPRIYETRVYVNEKFKN